MPVQIKFIYYSFLIQIKLINIFSNVRKVIPKSKLKEYLTLITNKANASIT